MSRLLPLLRQVPGGVGRALACRVLGRHTAYCRAWVGCPVYRHPAPSDRAQTSR